MRIGSPRITPLEEKDWSPDARAELARTADVLVENFAAGVMERLGLTYEVLSAESPRLVMMRLPGMGSTGPESGYNTFGNTIEAMVVRLIRHDRPYDVVHPLQLRGGRERAQ